MTQQRTTVWQFLKRALHHTWLYLYYFLWSIFGSLTRVRDNFLPQSWKQALETQHLLDKIPSMHWQTWGLGILFGIIVAIVRSALLQLRGLADELSTAQERLTCLEQRQPEIELTVHEVLQRPSFETHAFWNRDIFIRVSAELRSPQSVRVDYSLSVILQGKTVSAEWLKDVLNWCRTEIVRNSNPVDPSEDKPCYEIDELSQDLCLGEKIDGWLHFRTCSGFSDGLLGKCKLRLMAKSEFGASYADVPEGSIPVIPRGWKIILKKDILAYSVRSAKKPLPAPV